MESGMLTQASLAEALGLVVALACGALIGLERQLRGHPAGLHTNALVALGSAAFVMAGVGVGDTAGSARVVGQVVTGVGFLCAGVIMHQGATVRGITTAATVWCSAAVGVFAGLGRLPSAGFVSVLVVLANVVLHYVEHGILNSGQNSPRGQKSEIN
jgi:putative Mg2+ transporter-C (MgtC) family protein